MNLQENIHRIKQMMGVINEDFNWDKTNKVVTQEKSDEIYGLLLKMFPDKEEIIRYHYNDEMGYPFAEWRRKIHDIREWVLEGPIVVNPEEIQMEEEFWDDRKEKFDDYVSGKSDRYFRDNKSDPRNIDFSKLPPVTLVKFDDIYEVNDGGHRVFLAKMMNKPLKSYVWVHKQNDSPYVEEIEKLFK
jgi:hypothetical protein